MDRYGRFYTRKLKKVGLDIKASDFDSKKRYLRNGKIGDVEVDIDYIFLLKFTIKAVEQTNVIRSEDQNDSENEKVNENENVNVYENEDEDVDDNDKDPQYLILLENLTEHGKSYKLKISQNDEEPCYIYYEDPYNSDWCDELQTSIDNSGEDISDDMQIDQKAIRRVNEKKRAISTKRTVSIRNKIIDCKSKMQPHQGMLVDSSKEEVSRRKKINDHKSIIQPHRGMIVDSSYQMYPSCIPSEHVAVKTEENLVEYGKKVTLFDSDSDSDLMILNNVQNCSEVNNKQLVLAEEETPLREKLMHILEQPFNEKEYEELSEYIEQKKPICRLIDLRGRAISSAFSGVRKSVLDDGPGSFRRMLDAAQNDPPKALNLLRMFRFWLEHVPNEDVFIPWRDKHIRKVRPSEKKAP